MSNFVVNNLWPKNLLNAATFTFGLGDVHTTREGIYGAGDMTVTVPADSGIPFTLGGHIKFLNSSANNMIFSPAGGVTINPFTPTLGPGGFCEFEKTGANTYLVVTYESTATFATNWQGIWAAQQVGNFTYTRGFNTVTLQLPGVTASSITASTISNVTALPTFLRPSINQNGLTTIVNNSLNALGTWTINTLGTVTICGTVAYGNFAGTGTEGFNAQSISYKI